MKVDVDNLSNVKKKINVVLPKESIEEKFDKAYSSIKSRAKIKGFRSGKAPINIIKKYYGEQVKEEVLREALKESYPLAIKEGGIQPVSFPLFGGEAIMEGEDFAFSFTVDVKPDIEPSNYIGIPLGKKNIEISEDDISGELKKLQEKFATKKPVTDRSVEKGDEVTFDFEPFGDMEKDDNPRGKNQTIVIGSGKYIPGFEEAMIGMKKGEVKDIKVDFPPDYHNKEFAGKEAVYKVSIKDIYTIDYPPLDNEFAKNVEGFETLQDLKDRMREEMELSNKETSLASMERELIDAIIKENQFDIPESMVEEQFSFKREDARKKMMDLGMQKEVLDSNLKEIDGEIREEAERDVRAGLLIEAIALKEGIKLAEDDIEKYYQEMSENTGKPVDEIKKFFDGKKDRLIATIIDKKTLEFLMSKAKIEEK